MKIVFLPEALEYFNEDGIRNTLPQRLKKTSPPYFDRYGKMMLYSTFRKNKTTLWYIFFNVYQKGEEKIFLIRYISNNHVIAQYL